MTRALMVVVTCALLCSCALAAPSATVESEVDPLSVLSSAADTTDPAESATPTVVPDEQRGVFSVLVDGEDAAKEQSPATTATSTTTPDPAGLQDESPASTEAQQTTSSTSQQLSETPTPSLETDDEDQVTPQSTASTAPSTTTTDSRNRESTTSTTSGSVLNVLPPRLQRELVQELNDRRSKLGLGPVEFNRELANEAEQCALESIKNRELAHCDHEVLWMGGIGTSADQLLEAWFNSDLHMQALTYSTSTAAGGALVVDLNTGLAVAALRINY